MKNIPRLLFMTKPRVAAFYPFRGFFLFYGATDCVRLFWRGAESDLNPRMQAFHDALIWCYNKEAVANADEENWFRVRRGGCHEHKRGFIPTGNPR